MFTLIIRWLVKEGCERNLSPNPNKRFTVSLKPLIFMKAAIILISFLFCSCASYKQSDEGFFPAPGMDSDSQDRYNTKYNLLDSSDGSEDPNAQINIFKQKF